MSKSGQEIDRLLVDAVVYCQDIRIQMKVLFVFLITFMFCFCSVADDDGMVGFWRFNEGTGSAAADDSGYDNDGTISGTAWTGGENGGSALSFTSSADYVSCPDDSSLNFGTGDFTVAFWVKFLEGAANYQGIIGKLDSSWMGWGLQRFANGNLDFYLNGCHNFISCDTLANDIWYHVAIIRKSQDAILYINGVYIGKVTQTTNADSVSTTANLIIGKCRADFGVSWSHIIDEVRIYNQALNEDDIRVIYNGLVGYWKMDEGENTTVYDSSEYGNDAVLVNMDEDDWDTGHINFDGYFRTSLNFGGTNAYIYCPDDSSLNFGTGDFTVAFWVKFLEGAANYQGIIGKLDSSWMGWGLQRFANGNLDFYLNGCHNYISCGTLANNIWYHVAIIRESQDAILYINGVYIGKVTQATNADSVSTTANLIIGKCRADFGVSWGHIMDDVRIANRALSTEDIQALLNYDLLSSYPDRTYYTTEGSAVAVCNIDIPATELANCYITAKDEQQNTLGTNTIPEDNTDLTYSISSLSTGSHTITVELRHDTGELALTCNMDIIKQAANPGFENKVDRKNGVLLRDGSEFFPIGFYMIRVYSNNTVDFSDVSNAGFNSVIRMGANLDPSDATSYLNAADDYDLLVVDKHEAYAGLDKLSETFYNDYLAVKDDILDAVDYAGEEANLLSYYSFDEPLSSQVSAGEDLYAQTNLTDGYHPTFVVFGSRVHQTNWCDIVGIDPYWIPPNDSSDLHTSLNWVTKYVDEAKKRVGLDHKALWVVLMAERYSQCHKRIITPDEQRCQTYVALINGAKGIFYYSYPIYHDDSWNMLSDLAGEMDDLAPSLMTPDLDQDVTYYSNSAETEFDPANEQFVDVQVCLREAPAGASYDYVLLAANTREYSVDVDYTVSLLGSSGTVSRLFDASTYTVTNGEFSDTLAAYATRAYTFSSASTSSVAIDVDVTPGTPPASETAYPKSGRSGYANLMPNPSLEDAVVVNWPDYCRPKSAVPRINTANQAWGLDASSPYHGSKCLKMKNTGNGFQFYFVPEAADLDEDYTFSIYLKADKANCKVRISYNGENVVESTITTSWARYTYTCNISDDVSSLAQFVVQISDDADGGVVWADAVQVEKASSASAFTMD